MTQKVKIVRIKNTKYQSELTSARAITQYLVLCTLPYIHAAVHILAPGKE